MTRIKNKYPLIIISLVLLFNPSVNIIDVFPDCIAYLLLLLVISSAVETVPYLAECATTLVKLALLTVVKIPAFTVMYSNMNTGRDIVPLFTIVFITLELILLYSLVTNAYLALNYISERTDCRSLREPSSVGMIRTPSLEQLRILTYAFFLARGLLNLMPELMLLTPEDTSLRKKLAEAYPAVIVICVLSALVIGLVWLTRAVSFVKAVKRGGDIGASVDSLVYKGTPDEMSSKERIKKLNLLLTILAISSIFIFDIRFTEYGGYNLLPHFIYGIVLFFSVYSFTASKRTKVLLTVFTAGYAVCSLVGYFLEKRFLEAFTYVDLKYSAIAKSDYRTIKILAVAELIFALAMLCQALMATVDFIRSHTDVSPDDPAYSKTNEKNHKRIVNSTLPVFVISAIIHVLKTANVFIKQTTEIIPSAVTDEGVAVSGFPAMDTIIFLTSVVFVICSFVKASNLKDEVKFKYGKE